MKTGGIIGIIVVALVVIIGIFIFSFTGTEQPSSTVPAPGFEGVPETVVSPTPTPTPTPTEVKEISVDGTEYSFSPSSISVEKGDRVRITFSNVGGIVHNFGISELGVRTSTISVGNSDSIEFVADKSGTFDFDCSVPGHGSLGMRGSLVISE